MNNKKDIEEIELEEDDIEEYTETNIHVNCPKCGYVYDEYDIDFETDYICECEKCGHKFKFNYCPY